MTAQVLSLCASDEDYLARVAVRRPSIMALLGLLPPSGDPAREICGRALCVMAQHLPEPDLGVEDICTLLNPEVPEGVIEDETRSRFAGPSDYLTRLLSTCFAMRVETPGGGERLYLVALMSRLQRGGQG